MAEGQTPVASRPKPVAPWFFWSGVALGVFLDQSSKLLAFWLAGGSLRIVQLADGRQALLGPEVIPGFLYITPVRNPGMAFSLGHGLAWPIIALMVTAIAAYVIYHRYTAEVRAARWAFDLSMIFVLSGAIGNLIDRLRPPHQVLDFIDVWFGRYSYPVFNFADAYILIGVCLYAWWGWSAEGRVRGAKGQKEGGGE